MSLFYITVSAGLLVCLTACMFLASSAACLFTSLFLDPFVHFVRTYLLCSFIHRLFISSFHCYVYNWLVGGLAGLQAGGLANGLVARVSAV